MMFDKNVRVTTERLRQCACPATCQFVLPMIALVAFLSLPKGVAAGEARGGKAGKAKVTTGDAKGGDATREEETAKTVKSAGRGGKMVGVARYRFEAGKRYVYEVRVEATTPDGLEVTSGHSYYAVKSVNAESGNMTLTNTGSLSTRPGGDSRRGFPFPPRPPIPPIHRFGPPFGSPETDYSVSREIVIDPTGKIIRSTGHAYLPALLGDLWELVLDPMPPEGKRAWESSHEILVVKRDIGFPWRPPCFAGKEVNRPARQTVKFTLGKTDAGVVTIEKKYELVTEEKVGDKPFLIQVGEGQIEFDLARGAVKSLQMEYNRSVA